MQKLNLPPYSINVRQEDGKQKILDILRRRFVKLTPEEWVRQHFIHYLIEHLGYPQGLLANETELIIGDKRLRCDSVLYGTDRQPKMIIEYKAPKVQITQKVFDQISAYNILLHVDYLIISNGMQHYCLKMDYDTQSYHFLNEIPQYNEIKKESLV